MLEQMAAVEMSEETEKKPLMTQSHTCDSDLKLRLGVGTNSSLSPSRIRLIGMRCDAAQWRERLSARLRVDSHHV